jgi:hypothetical protein
MTNNVGKGGNLLTRRNPFTTSKVASAPDMVECRTALLGIEALLRAECAIIISRTRDGGAICLTVLDGDDRHRTYCSSEDELEEAFSAIAALYVD